MTSGSYLRFISSPFALLLKLGIFLPVVITIDCFFPPFGASSSFTFMSVHYSHFNSPRDSLCPALILLLVFFCYLSRCGSARIRLLFDQTTSIQFFYCHHSSRDLFDYLCDLPMIFDALDLIIFLFDSLWAAWALDRTSHGFGDLSSGQTSSSDFPWSLNQSH